MRKRLLVFVGVAMFVIGAFATTAMAGPSGQGIGQDPIRLALTRCASAHGNNVEEWIASPVGDNRLVERDDCLGHAPGTFFSEAEIAAIRQAAGGQFCFLGLINTCPGKVPPTQGCYFVGAPSGGGWFCDIDPGNAGAHNNAARQPFVTF